MPLDRAGQWLMNTSLKIMLTAGPAQTVRQLLYCLLSQMSAALGLEDHGRDISLSFPFIVEELHSMKLFGCSLKSE